MLWEIKLGFEPYDYLNTNNLYTPNSIKDELNDDIKILFSDVLMSYDLLEKCIDSKDDYNLIIDRKIFLARQ